MINQLKLKLKLKLKLSENKCSATAQQEIFLVKSFEKGIDLFDVWLILTHHNNIEMNRMTVKQIRI